MKTFSSLLDLTLPQSSIVRQKFTSYLNYQLIKGYEWAMGAIFLSATFCLQ